MTHTSNGDPQPTEVESRDIPTAVGDAVAEHKQWLGEWQRALLCGLQPDARIRAGDAGLNCRFGRWFSHNRRSGLLEGELFESLGRAHDELHEAARAATQRAESGQGIPVDEYDALIDVAALFRNIALRVQEVYGRPEDSNVAASDDLAEMQSRFNMLVELEREWERAARMGTPMSLVMVRPVGLEEIERDFGQIGLDRAIAGLATRLLSQLRPYDAIFRYRRSDFLLCLPGVDAKHAEGLSRRLCAAVEERPFALSESVESSLSARFGIALTDPRTSVRETLDRTLRASNMAGTGEGERVALWSAELEN